MSRTSRSMQVVNTELRPVELDLYGLPEHSDPNFRNLVTHYELFPFYEGVKLDVIPSDDKDLRRESTVEIGDKTWSVRRWAGAVVDKDDNDVRRYSGPRERCVMEGIQKLAEFESYVLGPYLAVPFYWKQLQRACSAVGKVSISIPELQISVAVLQAGNTQLKCLNPTESWERNKWVSPQINSIMEAGHPDSPLDEKDNRMVVTLHPLLTAQILQLGYRQYNYTEGKRLTAALAPITHKRLAARFLQSSDETYYEVRGSTIRNWGNLDDNAGSYALRRKPIVKALEQLQEAGVIESWSAVKKYEARINGSRRISLVDEKFRIYCSAEFTQEQRRASAITKDLKARKALLEEGTVDRKNAIDLKPHVIKAMALQTGVEGQRGTREIDIDDEPGLFG